MKTIKYSLVKNVITRYYIFLLLPFTLLTQHENLNSKLEFGKYGCTATIYRNGSYKFIPKGYFIITKTGNYTYQGFDKPSSGTYEIDKKGNLNFKGGYFDGGIAEKIDRLNKFFLVFPANPDNRWTCGLVIGKP